MDHSTKKPNRSISRTALANQKAAGRLERVNRTLNTLNAVHRTILRTADEQDLLHRTCRDIVEAGGYRFSCVAGAGRDDGKDIQWLASNGIDTSFLETFHSTCAGSEPGCNATLTAIRTGEPVVCHNLVDPAGAGPVHAAMRERATQVGQVSVTALPLHVDAEVLGALVIASAELDSFDEAEVKLLSELADDLAYGIANLRSRLEHRAAQATIVRLAYYDPLTGLPNRTRMLEDLTAAIDQAPQGCRFFALLHLEFCRFHEIRNVLGCRLGDQLLKELAGCLAGAVPGNKTLARVGEAEFALLLPNARAEESIQEAQRLIAILRQPVQVSDLRLNAQVGIGIALFPDHATDADELLRRANVAMQRAKPTSGGYAVYSCGQERGHTRRLSLMGDLHLAVTQDQLSLYCQPKVDFASSRVCGAEALIRWQHPQHGMISPKEFIPIAEQAGIITPLTNWMLEAAFRQSRQWHEAGRDWTLAVNLSALDLYDSGLIDRIGALFSTWRIASGKIQFELTESALMVDPVEALETLVRLKRLGVRLFIDDFGTGQSSLSYLQKLPVDAIKIDQSFIQPMLENADSAVIVSSTIELGHSLGLKVVAEGIENQETWNHLAELGCDIGQGYFISRPMPAAQFHEWETSWARNMPF